MPDDRSAGSLDGESGSPRVSPPRRTRPGAAGEEHASEAEVSGDSEPSAYNLKLISFTKSNVSRDNLKQRGKLSAEEQDLEHRVLTRLAAGEPVKVSTLRTATAATRSEEH